MGSPALDEDNPVLAVARHEAIQTLLKPATKGEFQTAYDASQFPSC
jgi:hypothetical protein